MPLDPRTHPGSLTLPAPAKLNLLLRILGRRPDGYHELQTLFQLLDFGDELRFAPRDDSMIAVEVDGAPGHDQIPLQDNLVYRAAMILRNECGCSRGANIHLRKRLPMGGGIGGGSSDAATTLLGLNRLWRCNLSIDRLAELGRKLGADVPVFVRGHTAWAEGIGEALVPVDTEKRHYLVVVPGCSVSTAAVFQHPRLTRDSGAITLPHLRDGRLDPRWLEEYSTNDCQALVEDLYPQVRAAREWLQQFAQAQLTGTGACVFAAFDSSQEAQQVLRQLPTGWKGFVAAGVNTSPTHERLANAAP
ncbi:4-diphosphocytidyl-2-C-methyl-D-erythritol kinase [Microbulbifer yueqingensis]|uniref:4-diphosphocytidyl-2-C-methyl-D-erythritol kinase n=2 Tax=Microbulbifer yueqingensis TaxID=658219 RepID=A0A1G8X689_9GAMM|nr:4-(cytidine 5'-diphospho)-2-C-methyl-D-erythritol kinase [Microbulbifer yueqingensis]SDJ85270.1 4-diphosphocytidyl-2-C-methyl-D-erythritol kinase [Microbulbifer yueqingensis]